MRRMMLKMRLVRLRGMMVNLVILRGIMMVSLVKLREMMTVNTW